MQPDAVSTPAPTPQPPAPTPKPPSPAVLSAVAQLKVGWVLRPLVLLATGISAYFHLRQFLSAAFVLRYNPDLAYVTLLAAYAGHREIRRWVQDPAVIAERARRGEVFVVFWWLFYYVTLMAANHVAAWRVPDGLLALAIEVTTIFFGTLTSRHLAQRRRARLVLALSLEERILQYLDGAAAPVKRLELEERLGVSRSTMQRTLKSLEEQGKVEWVGRSEFDPDGGFRRRG